MGKGCLRFPVGADRCVCPMTVAHDNRAHTPVRPYNISYHIAFPVGADRCVCPKKVPHNGRAHTPVRPYKERIAENNTEKSKARKGGGVDCECQHQKSFKLLPRLCPHNKNRMRFKGTSCSVLL